MNIYEAENEEAAIETIIKQLEKNTQQKIFTIRISGENEKDNSIETLIVFQDKSILSGKIFVTEVLGKMAIRLQGNYI